MEYVECLRAKRFLPVAEESDCTSTRLENNFLLWQFSLARGSLSSGTFHMNAAAWQRRLRPRPMSSLAIHLILEQQQR